MSVNQDAFNQIAMSLARNYDSLYYVNTETDAYIICSSSEIFSGVDIPSQGNDFFKVMQINAPKYVHPDDIALTVRIFNKEAMLDRLAQSSTFSAVYRMIIGGRILHMRHSEVMCDDRKHIMCCLENIEDDFRKKEEQEKNLESARKMARRDALTGIRNKNAFCEYSELLSTKVQNLHESIKFAVVMCDVNDLKKINDTRGHSFGDEAIQLASRMICDIYDHSPVFRIGGDEFVVVLDGRDYNDRDVLLKKLRDESVSNMESRSGPVVACGMSVYAPESDSSFDEVFRRADKQMYENKKELKALEIRDRFLNVERKNSPITAERRRLLDGLFGALYTVSGDGYIYLTDMQYDFARWSLPLIDDFGLKSQYMYHADRIWQECIHPDDLAVYRDAVDKVFTGAPELQAIRYRAKKADGTYVVCYTRGFVMNDINGSPEYFGGIILTD